ncbi:MAG: hypothetical protein ABDH49_08190 [Candidatus Hydrothermales bacterium]
MNIFSLIIIFNTEIKEVKIVYKPLFESNFFLYKIVEKLTFKPKSFRVKSLLIKNRDSVVLSESLRRIKNIGVFSEIENFKKRDTLIIKLRPLLTLALFFNFEGGGGLSQKGIGLWEHNLFGLLLDIRLNYIWGYEYPYFYFQSFYPEIFKNHDISIFFLNSEHSKTKSLSIFPYISPYTYNRIYLNYTQYFKRNFLYEKGIIIDSFTSRGENFMLEISRSLEKFKLFLPSLGYGFAKSIYNEFNFFHAGFEIDKTKTKKTRFIKNFGETEHMKEGLFLKINLYKNINNRIKGIEGKITFNNFERNFNSISSATYKNFMEKSLNLNSSNYFIIKNFIVFAIFLGYEKIWEPYCNTLCRYLGGLYGLRGYKAFYFRTSNYVLNISEIRLYFKELLEFFKPGIVFFVDNAYIIDKKTFAFSYGVGIRIELTKSYNLPVLRLDLGFSKEGKYLSFGEGKSF